MYRFSFLFIGLLFIIHHPLDGQNREIKPTPEGITITAYRNFGESQPSLIAQFTFDDEGKIKQIIGDILHPVDSKDPQATYFATYHYSEGGNLVEEKLFEQIHLKTREKRRSKYSYGEGFYNITVYDGMRNQKIGELEVYHNASTKRQYFKLDRVLSDQLVFWEGANAIWKYDVNDNLEEIVLKKKENTLMRMQFQYERPIVKRKTWSPQISESSVDSVQCRLYNKSNQLVKIGPEKVRKDWYYKVSYNKYELIQKIIHRGRWENTNEKVRSIVLFELDIDNKTAQKLKSNPDVVEKINHEILNLYHPLTGKDQLLNYFDSRRFLSFQG